MENRIQVWFDKMVRGLAKQNWERALAEYTIGSSGPICLYRTPDGKACAIGQIIPDNAEVIQTGAGVMSSGKNYEDLGLGDITDPDERNFLEDAQQAHDSAGKNWSADVRQNFKDIAKQYGLTWTADVQ